MRQFGDEVGRSLQKPRRVRFLHSHAVTFRALFEATALGGSRESHLWQTIRSVLKTSWRKKNLGLGTRRRPVVLAAAAILLLAVTGLFVRAGLRNGRLASVVEGLKSAVATPAEATTDTTRKDKGTKGAAAAQNTAAGAATASGPGRSADACGVRERHHASARVRARVTDGDAAAGARGCCCRRTRPTSSRRRPWRAATGSTRGPMRRSRRRGRSTRRCPPDPSPGRRPEDLTVLDLVVAADGQVEHVRLRTTPRDVHEFMLVSAAKAWRFEPATVDGRPVRFRHSVAITSPD